MKSNFEKYNEVTKALRISGANCTRKFKSVGTSQAAMIAIQYTAKNREQVLNRTLNAFHQLNDIGTLSAIVINDSANYVERNEQLMRNNAIITHCETFDEVEDISPVTHGTVVVEVVFQ